MRDAPKRAGYTSGVTSADPHAVLGRTLLGLAAAATAGSRRVPRGATLHGPRRAAAAHPWGGRRRGLAPHPCRRLGLGGAPASLSSSPRPVCRAWDTPARSARRRGRRQRRPARRGCRSSPTAAPSPSARLAYALQRSPVWYAAGRRRPRGGDGRYLGHGNRHAVAATPRSIVGRGVRPPGTSGGITAAGTAGLGCWRPLRRDRHARRRLARGRRLGVR